MGGIFNEEDVLLLAKLGDLLDFGVNNAERMLDTDGASALGEVFFGIGD